MAGWTHLHRSPGNTTTRQFLELVIHAGELLLHIVGGLLRDVEVSSAVLRAPPLAYFRVDSARYHVPGGKLHPFRVILLHAAFAQLLPRTPPPPPNPPLHHIPF